MEIKFKQKLGAGEKIALLVSDMQIAFTQGKFTANFSQDKEIIVIQKMLDVANLNNIPIIYTVIAFTEEEVNAPNLWLQKIPELSNLTVGSNLAEIDPRLKKDIYKFHLVTKKYPSSFAGTNLKKILHSLSIDTLIITGCTTSGCVRATVVEGMENNIRMLVTADAVADRWPDSHRQSLYEMNAKYADVIDSAYAIKLMQS